MINTKKLRAKAISYMQIQATLARLVRLNFGPLSRYLDQTFGLKTFAEPFCRMKTSDLDQSFQSVKGLAKSLHFLAKL